ncbi:MFS transporter [Ralstonia sp. NFACC01]|jgi:DHA2 family methylenomycin A resistance protein-like MFS transporter|uniref:MFS transporter n=1 Tax=Ralstonia sp. NFACC01 TaxID=1566294 RepID=UPI0008F3DF4E|nr:MFS transporter [Ralstonia sp. NFACC01]SFP78430.1 MFS transporter, DHA2 family, methylenomycin A resistance protein [Ralstonia sp. NFACC01]
MKLPNGSAMSSCHANTLGAGPRADLQPDLSRWRRNATLGILTSGVFMAVLDTTVVNVALIAMRDSLHSSVAELAWIVDAYTLAFAAFILTGGLLSDRIGARTVFMAGMAVFIVASAGCGLAPSVTTLIAARILQGVGAAMFLPSSLSLIRSTFEDPRERAWAIGLWGAIVATAAAVGPALGGVLVDSYGWRSAFLINVPLGVVGMLGTWVIVRHVQPARAKPFDWAGQVTSAVMLAALCFAAIEWPVRGAQSPWVWGTALLTVVAGVLFVLAERRARAPLVPLAWLGHRTLGAVNGVGFLLNFGYYGALFVLSLHLQNVEQLSARQTGLVMLPMAVSLSAGNIFAGKLMAHFSTPTMMLSGLLIGAAGLLATSAALTGHVHIWVVSATMMAYGGGTALAIAPMTSTILSAAPGELAGTASGLLNAARQTGSLLGVAAAGAVVTVVPGLAHASPLVFGLMTLSYAGAMAMAWISRRPAATALVA